MRKYKVFLLVIFIASCSSSGNIVEPEYLVQYESSSSFHNLWYKGSDKNYHYFQHMDKIKTDYRVSRKNLNWPEEKIYGELQKYVVVWPGTIEKALSNK